MSNIKVTFDTTEAIALLRAGESQSPVPGTPLSDALVLLHEGLRSVLGSPVNEEVDKEVCELCGIDPDADLLDVFQLDLTAALNDIFTNQRPCEPLRGPESPASAPPPFLWESDRAEAQAIPVVQTGQGDYSQGWDGNEWSWVGPTVLGIVLIVAVASVLRAVVN